MWEKFESNLPVCTYMVERLSDVSSKTGKKCIFCVFRLFWSIRRTASRPFRLRHIIALYINQLYWPKDQSMKFSQKFFENWRFWKTQFFWVGRFGFFFQKKNCYCFIPMKIGQSFLGIKNGLKFWWLPWFPAKNHSPQTFQPAVYINYNLTGGIRWVVYDIVVYFWKMYISSLSCKSTMYYWWIISSGSVSPHSSIVVNFSVFPAILQGPPRQSFFLNSLLIRNIWISIQIMAAITSEGLIFSTKIYDFLTQSEYWVLMRYRPYFCYIFKCLLVLEKF